MNDHESDRPGQCVWCDADFSRYGRFFGALAETLHALRRHWGEMEQVADGADPKEVDPGDGE